MKANSGALLAVMAVAALATTALAIDYTVGGSQGWDTYIDYDKWVTGKMFMVGDTLTFKYQPYHNVLEVTEADYGTCNADNALSTYSGGDTTFKLTETGTRYFICGIPFHCTNGTMHVQVATVPYSAAAATAAAAAAAPSPAPVLSPPADSPGSVADYKNTQAAPAAAPTSTSASAPRYQQPAAAVAGLALAALMALAA